MVIIIYFTAHFKKELLKKVFFTSVFLVLTLFGAQGQEQTGDRFIQIDGVTNDEDGVIVPNVSIYSKHLRRGAASDFRGIFSIISVPGDTIFFSAVGYKPTLLTVSPALFGTSYITDVRMIIDTISIGDVVVMPWRTYSEFKRAILHSKPEDPVTKNMQYNLALVEQQIWQDLKSTPGQGYRYTVQQMTDNLYTRGQTPYNNLLNPMAWSKFVKEVKNGLLKNEKTTKHKSVKAKVRKKKVSD